MAKETEEKREYRPQRFYEDDDAAFLFDEPEEEPSANTENGVDPDDLFEK